MTLVDLPVARPVAEHAARTASTAGAGVVVESVPCVPGAPGTSPPDRAALARAVLARAEQRTGVRRSSTDREWSDGWVARTEPVVLSASVSAAHLVSAARLVPGEPVTGAPPLHGPDLPVAPEVRRLLPGGVLRRGRTVVVTGSRSLLLALVAAASADGAWLAAVGLPELGLVAAAEAGVDLDRVALVPAPGPDAPAAVAALLDGVDVVLVGPRAALADGDRRRLQARARERGAVLLATTPWPGAHVVLDAHVTAWSGAAAGSGWLRRQEVAVERTGRAGTTPGRFEVQLPLGVRAAVSWTAAREVRHDAAAAGLVRPRDPARPADPADERPDRRHGLRRVV